MRTNASHRNALALSPACAFSASARPRGTGRDRASKAGVRLAASLPDDWVNGLIRKVAAGNQIKHIPVGREAETISICAGAFFGGVRAGAIMGNTGLLTCTGEMATLCLRHMIPVFCIVSARGSIDDHKVYQEVQGRRTRKPKATARAARPCGEEAVGVLQHRTQVKPRRGRADRVSVPGNATPEIQPRSKRYWGRERQYIQCPYPGRSAWVRAGVSRRKVYRGVSSKAAYGAAYSGRGSWFRSNHPGLTRAYPPAWFTGRLVSLATRWDELNLHVQASGQLVLPF
jgi:sulfopyruvate decarboxylase TPP-binding subunit